MAEEKTSPQPSVAEAVAQEAADGMSPFVKKVVENLKLIVAVVVVLLVATGGWGVYKTVKASALEKAVAGLGAILIQENSDQKITALETFLGEAPEAMAGGIQLEIARTAMEIKAYDRAIQAWQALAHAGGERLRVVAALGEAQALLRSGKAKEALDLVSGLKATAPEAYKSTVTWKIATLAEAAGETSTALAAYEELRDLDGDQANRGFYDSKINALSAQAKG